MLHGPLADALPIPSLPIQADECKVLVVDDDRDCLAEYAETITALGYVCRTAEQVGTALRLLAEDPTIGIVLTDLHMPTMDGFTLLDEISARFLVSRPLVTVVVTGQTNIDSAIRAMRSNAVDFLPKPVKPDDLSAVLRRAKRRWMRRVGQFQLAALVSTGTPAPETSAIPHERVAREPTNEELISFVRSILRSRQRRGEFLDTTLFADPAWDILLDLTSAGLERTPVPTSSACAAAQVPLSTALRHVRHLVNSGLVKRWQDRNDKRRTLLALEDSVLEAMTGYLMTVWRRDAPTTL